MIKRNIDKTIIEAIDKFDKWCHRFSFHEKKITEISGLSCTELRYLLLKNPQIKRGGLALNKYDDFKKDLIRDLERLMDDEVEIPFPNTDKYFRNRLSYLKTMGFIIKEGGKYGKYKISENTFRYLRKRIDVSILEKCKPENIIVSDQISYYSANPLPKEGDLYSYLRKEIEPILLDVGNKLYNKLWKWEEKSWEDIRKMSDEELEKEEKKEFRKAKRIYEKHKYPDPIIVININDFYHLSRASMERTIRISKMKKKRKADN